jgi:hypothetical protein
VEESESESESESEVKIWKRYSEFDGWRKKLKEKIKKQKRAEPLAGWNHIMNEFDEIDKIFPVKTWLGKD